MRTIRALLVGLLVCLPAAGCGISPGTRIEASGPCALTPEGTGAVLRVTVPTDARSLSGHTTWGRIATADLAEDFAERLAYVASQGGGLDIVPRPQWERRLTEAGLQPTLQPTDEQLHRHAEALGLSYYLTADVHHCELRYVFFWSWAVVGYDLACHATEDEEALWQVRVQHCQRYASDREAMLEALQGTFRWLREHRGGEAQPP